MSIATELISKGAEIIKPLTYRREREKVSGAMWSGELELKYERVHYYFKLWIHFQEERDMTEEEVLGEFWPSSIKVLGDLNTGATSSIFGQWKEIVYYDTNWNTFITDNKILLNRDGWHTNDELKALVESKRKKLSKYNDDKFTEEDEQELLDNGFEILLAL